MFRSQTKNASFGVPSKDELKALKKTKSRDEIPEELFENLRVPAKFRKKLQAMWTGADPVNLECHNSREGFVSLTATRVSGECEVWLTVESEPDEENEDGYIEIAASEFLKPTPEELKWLKRVWTPFEPVDTIRKTDRTTQPNAKCPCNSGKKFKKCCGKA